MLGMLCLVGSGCCTDMAVWDQTSVTLVADTWPAGAWTFELLGGSCEAALPAAGDEDVCDGEAFTVRTTPDGLGFELLEIRSAPEEFELVIRHDGVEMERVTVEPEFDVEHPNGLTCGSVRYGDAVVVVGGP